MQNDAKKSQNNQENDSQNDAKKTKNNQANDSQIKKKENKKNTGSKNTVTENTDSLKIANLYLKPFDLGPEVESEVEDFKLVNGELEEIGFPDRRSYLMRREYHVNSEEGILIQKQSVDYLVVFFKGAVTMGFDQNASKVKGPQIELKEMVISKNCAKLQLKGDRDRPLPTCLECTDAQQFFLGQYSELESEVQVCFRRKKFLKNCREYDARSESCLDCDDGFFLYVDSEQEICIAKFPFCKEHNFESPSLVCKECQDGYLLTQGRCVPKVSIANCQSQQKNVCLVCDAGFSLSGSRCVSHSKSPFFSCPKSQEQSCDCGREALSLTDLDECVAVGPDNCILFASASKCIQCRNGFYVNSSQTCLKGEIPFCREYGDLFDGVQTCRECQTGYVLENNTCRETLDVFTRHCKQKQGERCLKCSDSTYRVDLFSPPGQSPGSLQVCTRNVFEEAYSNSKDCLLFDSVKNRCSLCREGLWVGSDGQCGPCDLSTHAIDNLNSSCVKPKKLLKGCYLYDGDFCVRCTQSQMPKIPDESLFSLKIRSYSDKRANKFREWSDFLVSECQVSLHESCRTDFCDNAVRLANGNVCCQKCQFARSGVWARHEETYFTESCIESVEFCDVDTQFKGIDLEVRKYLTCHRCLEGKLVQMALIEGHRQTACVDPPESDADLENCLILHNSQCIVCRPKSRKMIEGLNQRVKCQSIPHCAFSETVGKCERCEKGFALDIKQENCRAHPVPNCARTNEEFECTLCADGFLLIGSHCFRLSHSHCASFRGGDCVSCSSEAGPQESNSPDKILINIHLDSQNRFTKSKKTLCLSPGDGKSNPTIANCEVYDTFDSCAKCRAPFTLQNKGASKTCVRSTRSTDSCQLLASDGSCAKCDHGKYLQGDRCLEGRLSGCLEYADQLNCAECGPGFVLLQKHNRQLCFFEHTIKNCVKTKTDSKKEGGPVRIKCLECESGFRRVQRGSHSGQCFSLRSIENCKRTNEQSGQCEECDDLYFLNARFECQRRTNLSVESCRKLDPKSDACSECEFGFSLAANGLNCKVIRFPAIPGCKVQKNFELECQICNKKHFMSKTDKMCFPVTNEVRNCMEYVARNLCSKCQKGFTLRQTPSGQVCQIQSQLAFSGMRVSAQTRRIDRISPETASDHTVESAASGRNPKTLQSIDSSKVSELNVDSKDSPTNSKKTRILENDELKAQPRFESRKRKFTLKKSRTLENLRSSGSTQSASEGDSQAPAENLILPCGLCRDGFQYSQESRKCETESVSGCLVSSLQNKCKICKTGHFQNNQGKCLRNYQVALENSFIKNYKISIFLFFLMLNISLI